LPKSNYQIQEKYCVDNQPADIKHLLANLNECGQLIIIHRNAENKVNPAFRTELSRLGLNYRQLNSKVDILYGNDTD
jgi:hypothetical protein